MKEKDETKKEQKLDNTQKAMIFVSVGSAICGALLATWITSEIIGWKVKYEQAKMETLKGIM